MVLPHEREREGMVSTEHPPTFAREFLVQLACFTVSMQFYVCFVGNFIVAFPKFGLLSGCKESHAQMVRDHVAKLRDNIVFCSR